MNELVEFLLARIAEDKAVIRRLLDYFEGSPLYEDGMDDMAKLRAVQDDTGVGWGGEYVDISISPARFLAECEAKRKIVNAYQGELILRNIYQSAEARALEDDEQATLRRSSAARARGLEIALQALASVHADHPDYPEEWAL